MVRMGSDGFASTRSLVWLLLTGIAVPAVHAAPVDDADVADEPRRAWLITPSIELAEIYSDNINLAPSGREDWDLVTEVTPGLALSGESARLKADAVYRMQHLLYIHEPSRSTVNHRFDGTGTAELINEHLFLDVNGVVTQVAIDPSRDASSDSVNSVPRSDVYSVRMGPRYQQNLGGYAYLNASYQYGIVRLDGGGASDSDISRADVRLASGRQFTRVGWVLSYYDETIDRSSESTVGDASHRIATAEASYALTRHLSLLGRISNEEHEFDTSQQGYANGTYTAGGFEWRPNRHLQLEALYGDKYKSAAIDWKPSRRTSAHIGWRDTEIGANVGEAWDADVSWRTRRFRTAFSYLEEPGTVQQLAQINIYYDPVLGGLYNTPGPGRVQIRTNQFGLTDEQFIRKRGQLSFGVTTGRTTGSIIIFDETREYTASGTTASSKGVDTAIKWRFKPRTSLLGNFNWSRNELRTSASEFDLWRIETGLEEQIGPNSYAQFLVSHQERSSGVGVSGYDENRIEARAYIQF